MADPISVASTIAGIVAGGVKLSTALYNICETIESAQEQVEDIASDLSFFIIVVDELGKIFAAPKRVYSDKLESSVLNIVQRCKHVFKKINGMIGKTAGLQKMQLRSKVAWVFREEKVRSVKASLESLKSTLGLILQTLRLVKDQRHDDKEERQVLGNLLRSQQRSVKVLRDLEKDGKKKPPLSPCSTSKGQPHQSISSSLRTAEVLSDAVPQLLAQDKPKTKPSRYEPRTTGQMRYAATSTDWRTFPVVQMDAFQTSLGDLYPLWKERILEQVDVLLDQWTQLSHEDPQLPAELAAESSAQTPVDLEPPGEAPLEEFLLDEDYQVAKRALNAQLAALEVEEESGEALLKKNQDLVQKLEDRLKKRENGWLEIDDSALKRVEDEKKRLNTEVWNCRKELTSVANRRDRFTTNGQAAYEDACERYIARHGRKDEQGEETYHRPPVSLAWLDEADPSEDSASEDDTKGQTSKHRTSFKSPAQTPEKPGVTHPSPSYSQQNTSAGSGFFGDPQGYSPVPTHGHAETSSFQPHVGDSQRTPPISPRPPHTYPELSTSSSDIPHKSLTILCQRQAWKPPQPYLAGSNTFSYVLSTAMHSCLWFKASQDCYHFYLGEQENSFYTIHLTPDDLSTPKTARIDWTVIEKPWATPKTLRAMGLQYHEDSVGFMWIRKELHWHQIQQLFEFSCGVLDHAVNESARQILRKRSADVKKRSFLSGQSKRDESIQEQHQVFFHADDEELLRRLKKPGLLRSKS